MTEPTRASAPGQRAPRARRQLATRRGLGAVAVAVTALVLATAGAHADGETRAGTGEEPVARRIDVADDGGAGATGRRVRDREARVARSGGPAERASASPRRALTGALGTVTAPPARETPEEPAALVPEEPDGGARDGAATRERVWHRLAECESDGDWQANTGNGYYGGLQFDKGSWDWAGGRKYADYPHHASKSEQIAVAERLLDIHPAGWGAWPACSRRLGLR